MKTSLRNHLHLKLRLTGFELTRRTSSRLSNMAAFLFFVLLMLFGSVPRDILLTKLHCEFAISVSLLNLMRNYASGRKQITVLNGVKSDLLPVSMAGIPKGSVLGLTLFVLFTNDLPSPEPTEFFYTRTRRILLE